MNIFEESEKAVTYDGLGTAAYVEIRGKKFPRFLVRLFIGSFISVPIVMDGFVCVNGYANGFGTILYTICMICSFSSAIMIYMALVFKTNEIAELFEDLRNTIGASNLNSNSITTGCFKIF